MSVPTDCKTGAPVSETVSRIHQIQTGSNVTTEEGTHRLPTLQFHPPTTKMKSTWTTRTSPPSNPQDGREWTQLLPTDELDGEVSSLMYLYYLFLPYFCLRPWCLDSVPLDVLLTTSTSLSYRSVLLTGPDESL